MARTSTFRYISTISFWLALIISLILHTSILALHFSLPHITAQNFTPPQLELVLVNSKSTTIPKHPDALAQSNLDGGGNTDANRRAKSPLPASERDQRENNIAAAQAEVQRLEAENRQLMQQLKSDYAVPPNPPQSATDDQNSNSGNNGQDASHSLEMAQLQAQIAQQYEAYQKRPRKLFIGARTQEYAFARYVEDWRIKIERIGNENYPPAAREQRIYGRLQLTVSIKADGTLDSVEITHPSGSAVLDNAAVAIVKLAAPYAPFSETMRKQADIISITRTWTFAPSDELSTQE